MAEQNNKYKIKGTIYDKKHDIITGKKDPTQSYDKYILTLEVTSSEERRSYKGTKYSTKTELPQFEVFNPKFDIDSFMIGDYVEIWFYLSGQKFTYKSGPKSGQDGIINCSPITFIKHADIDVKTKDGKVDVTATSDISELNKGRDRVFEPASPDDEIDLGDDLPFVLTIPIAIGFLSQFLI